MLREYPNEPQRRTKKSTKKKRQSDMHEPRENRFGKRRKNGMNKDIIDRNNEINFKSNDPDQLNHQDEGNNEIMIDDTPTDSMMMTAIQRKSLVDLPSKYEQVPRDYEEPTIEDTSFMKHELRRSKYQK